MPVNMENKKYNTNPLTQIPGGVTVVFQFSDGQTESHPRIKAPHKYIDKVATNCSVEGRKLIRATVQETGKIVYEVKS